MHRKGAFLILASIGMIAARAAEPTPTPAPAPAAKAGKPKMICKTITTTGSRLGGERVCSTAKDWEARTQQDRDEIDRMARNTVPNGQ